MTVLPIVITNRRTFNGGYGLDPFGRLPYGSGVLRVEAPAAAATGSAAAQEPADIDLVFTSGYGWLPYGTSPYGGGLLVVLAGSAAGSGAAQPPAVLLPRIQVPVQLVAIDGEYVDGQSQSNFIGDGYYVRHGLSFAAGFTGPNPVGGTFAGFDDPNFLLISNYVADPGFGFPVSEWLDIMNDTGLTGCVPPSGNLNPVDLANGGKAMILPAGEYPTPASIPAGSEAAVFGVASGEEPSTATQFENYLAANAAWLAASAPGRLSYMAHFDVLLNGSISNVYTPHDMATATDIVTCDLYYFAGAWDRGNGNPAEIPLSRYKVKTRLYFPYFQDLGDPFTTPCSPDETGRGAHYGSMCDSVRKWWGPGESRPYGSFVETGAPYNEPDSMAITPAQLKWAVWSMLVHGARIVSYFDHSFRPDSTFTSCTFNDPDYGYAGPGGTHTGIYLAAKTINRQVLPVASVLNSPSDGYFAFGDETEIVTPGFLTAVTSTNPRSPFTGVDAVAKWEPRQRTHYILAGTRESEAATNIPATFRMVDQGQTVAHEVFGNRNVAILRGGSIPPGFCEFSDTFPTAVSYHCYRIDNPVLTDRPGIAYGAGHAGRPTVRLVQTATPVTPAAAAATGSAFGPTIQVRARPGTDTASGAAVNAAVGATSSPGAGTAAGAGATQALSKRISTRPITVTGTGVAPTPGIGTGGQHAVTLTAADGESITGGGTSQSNFTGTGWWARVGHSRAANWAGPNPLGGTFAGFDDPNFLPIATWLTDYGGLAAATAYSRMNDLGLNGMLPASGAINLNDLITYGKWAVVTDESVTTGSVTTAQDPYVVGVSTGEEPSTLTGYDQIKQSAANWLAGPDGPGRFHAFNFADNLLNGSIEFTVLPDEMVVATANQVTAMDQYWYAGSGSDDAGGSRSKLHSRLYFDEFATSGAATTAQTARGCHYGSSVDCIRKAYASGSRAPFVVWIEAAAPWSTATSRAMTPAMLKWAVWSTLVHGARTIGYFVHNFRAGDSWGGAFWDDHFGGPGVTGTGVYAAAKEVNLRALQIAEVVNAPFDGYFVYGDLTTGGAISTSGFLTAVTSTNSRTKYSGVDASCRWHPTEQKHYILATTREQDGTTNWPVTFRMVDQGQNSAVPVFGGTSISISRGGSIPAGFCEFSDTFATAADYKCYRID